MDPALVMVFAIFVGLGTVFAVFQTAMNTAHIGSTLKRIEKLMEDRPN